MTKIFGIGLNKTGTSTLAECFKILGFSHTKCSRKLLQDFVVYNDFTNIFERVVQYDTFTDWPWPLVYQELDHCFPGNKFILTIRKDAIAWLRSLKKHSERTHPIYHCRKLAYGYHYPHGHEQEHIEIYENHNERAMEYFKNRPEDFLLINWENGDGWERLCQFLNRDIPKADLPHCYKGDYHYLGSTPLRAIINKMLRKILK